jgi:hypothetical protein
LSHALIDDKILGCRKALEAGEDATDLFIRGIIYCNEQLTDGFIPDAALDRVSRKRSRRTQAARLVFVGWWKCVANGWEVVDYLSWNPSRAVVEERRKLAKERKERFEEKRKADRVERVPNASGTRRHDDPRSSPLLSSTSEPSPLPPADAGEAGKPGQVPVPPLKPKRTLKPRPPSPEVDAVRAAIVEACEVEYPEACFDGLRARLRDGATLEQALAYVAWCARQPWERDTVRLDPEVLFRAKRFAAGLAKARAPPTRATPLPFDAPAYHSTRL